MSLKKNIRNSLLAGLLVSSVVVQTTNMVFAMESSEVEIAQSSSSISNEEIEELKDFLTDYGVDDSTILNLINKLKFGKVWDSLNPEKSNLGTVEKISEDQEKVTFPDGSILIRGVDFTQSKAIEGGSIISGSGYSGRIGARIYHNTGVVNAEFKADYTNVKNGYDRIDNVYSSRVKVIGGSYSGKQLDIIKKVENTYGKALAELSFDLSVPGMDSTSVLSLYVGSDKASTNFKL